MQRFLAKALTAFASKGRIETHGQRRGGPFRRSVAPRLAAACLGLGMAGWGASHLATDRGASAILTMTARAQVQITSAFATMVDVRGVEQLFPGAAPSSAGAACLAANASMDTPFLMDIATTALGGVEQPAARYRLTEEQVTQLARFSALMNLANCLRPQEEAEIAPPGSDREASELAAAWRDHLGEAHAVAFATLAMAREGLGTETAGLAARMRATRAALFGGSEEFQDDARFALRTAALEATSTFEDAALEARKLGKEGLASRNLAWLSDHAALIAERTAKSPAELAWTALALSESRADDEGGLVAHRDLPEGFQQALAQAQKTLGFRVQADDRVRRLASDPPAWLRPSEADEQFPAGLCEPEEAEEKAIADQLQTGERVIACGEARMDGSRDIFLADQAWQVRPAVLTARGELDRDWVAARAWESPGLSSPL